MILYAMLSRQIEWIYFLSYQFNLFLTFFSLVLVIVAVCV